MTEHELLAVLAAGMRHAGAEPEVCPLRPGDEDHLTAPDGLAQWLTILDDRTPGSDGPFTFDSPEFDKMLRATILLVIDYAPEPDADIYQLLARSVAFGNRVLIVQTVQRRWKEWLNYVSAHWRNGDFTRSSRLPRQRQAVSGMDRGQHAGWDTPWGPAFRLTRIAAGIQFFETATSSCYQLSPARNAEVPDYWRDVAISCSGSDGWYSASDAPILILTFPQYFGLDDVADARVKFETIFAPEIARRTGQ